MCSDTFELPNKVTVDFLLYLRNYLIVGHDVVILVTCGDLKIYVVAFLNCAVIMVFYCVYNLLDANS